MIISSITSAAVAASVWNSAARTLTNPSGVFSDAARSLTTIKNIQSTIATAFQSLAASGSLDLRPATNVSRAITIAIKNANGFNEIGLGDGTNLIPTLGGMGTGGTTGGNVYGSNSVGPYLKNGSATTATSYHVAGWDWT